MNAPTNIYPGPCLRCGETVAARTGSRRKVADRWTVEHLDGACPTGTAVAAAPTFAPTGEQQACIDLFLAGDSMVIEAGAGTGKTSTLRLLAEAAPAKRIQYVAFNRSIVADVSGTMPRNVSVRTVNSLAFAAAGRPFAPRLDAPRMRSYELAARLGLGPFTITTEMGAKTLSPEWQAGLVMRALTRFCQTADEKPGREHFGYIDGIDLPTMAGDRTFQNNDLLKSTELVPALHFAWADVQNTEGQLPFRHEHYVKMWQLTSPVINADVILFDECQDANPVLVAVIGEQTHAQVVFVGDANQSIYGFTGAVNAIEDQKALGIPTRSLTRSFRFGPAIADAANLVLAQIGSEMRLVGHDPIASVTGPLETADAILCRTNACAVEQVLSLQEGGHRPFLVGGGDQVVSFARGVRDLQEGRSTDHPELACFNSWAEVVTFTRQDAQGDDLRLLVDLVDRFGVPTILRALDRMPDENDCDVIVSTAHKAKGREWNRVQIAGDFVRPVKPGAIAQPPSVEDLRLRYVAITRAKLHLDHSALSEPTPEPATPVRRVAMGDRWESQHIEGAA